MDIVSRQVIRILFEQRVNLFSSNDGGYIPVRIDNDLIDFAAQESWSTPRSLPNNYPHGLNNLAFFEHAQVKTGNIHNHKMIRKFPRHPAQSLKTQFDLRNPL